VERLNFKATDFLAAAGGAVIGAGVGYALELPLVASSKWIRYAAIGLVIGLLILPLYRWLVAGREVVLENLEITLFGVKTKVSFSEAHRMVGWRIFVETATRISTQELKKGDGSLREALSSLYKLFDIVRTELKTQLPSAPPEQAGFYTIESYAVRMLNDALRPMLSRWHPRLASWEKKERPESEWELAELCRRDLETTRKNVLEYVRGLAQILKIHDLENILSSLPANIKANLAKGKENALTIHSALLGDEEIAEKEKTPGSYLDDAHKGAGWRIFVELASRIATQPIAPGSGNLREALDSLYKLYDLIRGELKQLSPPGRNKPDGDSVEKIGLSILNGDLREFLAKWHPLLSEWEGAKKPEAEWSPAADCRGELVKLRQVLRGESKRLGELINIKVEDYLD
jgi:hypothetical protein